MENVQKQIDDINERLERVNQVTFLDPTSDAIIGNKIRNYLTNNLPGVNGFQVFTSSGTFTVPSGVSKIFVRAVGGGSGGGGATSSDSVGTPGGSGGYAEKVIDVSNVGSVTVTIGAGGAGGSTASSTGTSGGDTTFGSYITCSGGVNDGSGGAATGGDLNITGYSSGIDLRLSATGSSTNVSNISAQGGDSFFGPGGRPARGAVSDSATGNDATAYGAGGSGAASGTGGGTKAGGAGKSGLVIVMY